MHKYVLFFQYAETTWATGIRKQFFEINITLDQKENPTRFWYLFSFIIFSFILLNWKVGITLTSSQKIKGGWIIIHEHIQYKSHVYFNIPATMVSLLPLTTSYLNEITLLNLHNLLFYSKLWTKI